MRILNPKLEAILAGALDHRGPGPVAWCRFCHRKHPRRGDHDLHVVMRTAKSGALVARWSHESSEKPKRRRARKS